MQATAIALLAHFAKRGSPSEILRAEHAKSDLMVIQRYFKQLKRYPSDPLSLCSVIICFFPWVAEIDDHLSSPITQVYPDNLALLPRTELMADMSGHKISIYSFSSVMSRFYPSCFIHSYVLLEKVMRRSKKQMKLEREREGGIRKEGEVCCYGLMWIVHFLCWPSGTSKLKFYNKKINILLLFFVVICKELSIRIKQSKGFKSMFKFRNKCSKNMTWGMGN